MSEERLKGLKEFKEKLETQFLEMREKVGVEVVFDNVRLDDEALRTPKLHNRWLSELSEQAYQLKKTQKQYDKLKLERWKYWLGKQTEKYYAEYGIVHEKALKTDLDKYLDADVFLTEMEEILELKRLIVDFLEKSVRDISNRGFAIKNAVEWRKFESGVV